MLRVFKNQLAGMPLSHPYHRPNLLDEEPGVVVVVI